MPRKPKPAPSPIPPALDGLAFPLADLVPDPHNARKHGPRNMDTVRALLRRFGWRGLVVADRATRTIVVGHARVAAALELGWTHGPVLFVDDADAARAAFGVGDNRSAELAEWEWPELARTLAKTGEDLVAMLGFDAAEISRILTPSVVAGGASEEWGGMPEFEQHDKTAFRSVLVHFKDQAAVDAFADAIGQRFTPATKYTWFPVFEVTPAADKAFIDEEFADDADA